jgi:hypothetical protein
MKFGEPFCLSKLLALFTKCDTHPIKVCIDAFGKSRV